MPSRTSRSYWVFIFLIILAHFVLHLAIGLGDRAPDLLTVAVLLGARRLRGAHAALLGFVLGVLNDALSLVAFGAEAVVLSLLGFLGARSRDLFEGDSMLFVGFYVFLGKWLHDVIYQFLARGVPHGETASFLLVHAPLAALYAAGAGVLALILYRATTGER